MAVVAGALTAVSLLAGCTTNKPVTRFYSLMPTLGTVDSATAAPAPAAPSRYFELLPVGLPLQDDQPQLVTEQPDGTFAVLEQQRWLGPLKNEIRDALSYRLSLRFADTPAARIAPAGGARALWRIGVDVQRFDSAPGRYARLDAAWSLRSPTDTTTTLICRSVFEEPAENDYPSLVQAHRAAVARLGDTIADTIFKLQAGGAPACP
jgi:hypothetical protein